MALLSLVVVFVTLLRASLPTSIAPGLLTMEPDAAMDIEAPAAAAEPPVVAADDAGLLILSQRTGLSVFELQQGPRVKIEAEDHNLTIAVRDLNVELTCECERRSPLAAFCPAGSQTQQRESVWLSGAGA